MLPQYASMTAPKRALLGFVAAALSVLTFHQFTWALLYAAGLLPSAPYPIDPVPPLGIPRIVNACFWGGLYGAAFGLVLPRLPRAPMWLHGLGVGVLAVLVLWAVVLPLKGLPPGGVTGMLVFALIHCVWGIGIGLILPLLMGRRRAALA
jgi:hypothetical protein